MRTRTGRTALTALALAIGCFNPSFKDEIACSPGGECPPDLTCGADRRCRRLAGPALDAPPAAAPDAPVDTADAAVELPPDAPAELPPDAPVAFPPDAPPIQLPPDAPPVGCQGDGDCATPPNACTLPGTCNLTTHVCSFPSVDCSGMSDGCNDGICAVDRGCIKVPAREGALCGQGTTCGSFGACGGFSDTCDSSGTQSRACTRFTCQRGACTGDAFTDTQACTRSTNGASCGATQVSGCGACGGFADTCAEAGTQTCTCTAMVCMNDSCTAVPSSCPQSCTRNTDGQECGIVPCAQINFTRPVCCRNGACTDQSLQCGTCAQ